MKLTKRQHEVMDFYEDFAEWRVVYGVDYRVAQNLFLKGLLELDTYTDKFKRADGPLNDAFPYKLCIVHDRYPVEVIPFTLTRAEVVGYNQRLYNEKMKPLVKAWCKERDVTMRSCYVMIDASPVL